MPRHKKGTLVRVKPPEEHEDYGLDDTGNVVANHGWMFRVIRFQHENHPHNDTGEDEYWCKSLASGEELALFPREITTKIHKEQTND